MDTAAFYDWAIAVSRAAVSAKDVSDAMSRLSASTVDWPMAIAQINAVFNPKPDVFPSLGIKLT